MIAYALRTFRQVLTLIGFLTVLFTEQVPGPLFDAIVMTYRYEWRAMSYAFFMHEDYPSSTSPCPPTTGLEAPTSLSLAYPEHVLAPLGVVAGFFAVLFTGEYPEGIRGFLVSAYRYSVRVEADVGFLTDRYPPFSLAA